MPTYEYECSKCKKNFDAFQTMSSEPYKICPEEHCCQKKWGKGKVKRLLGAGAGLIFKGSGFYITDYRSEGYKSAAKGDAASSSTSEKASPQSKNSTESKASSATNSKSAGGGKASTKASSNKK
ncbi:MAG: FmdB family zinc ribbon protein [Chthoniobacterales bacterium]